jgi:hypothetical protein
MLDVLKGQMTSHSAADDQSYKYYGSMQLVDLQKTYNDQQKRCDEQQKRLDAAMEDIRCHQSRLDVMESGLSPTASPLDNEYRRVSITPSHTRVFSSAGFHKIATATEKLFDIGGVPYVSNAMADEVLLQTLRDRPSTGDRYHPIVNIAPSGGGCWILFQFNSSLRTACRNPTRTPTENKDSFNGYIAKEG